MLVVLPVRADFDEAELDDLTRRAKSCESLNLVDSSTPSDTRRSALGRIETCAELGVEDGGSSEVAE